MMRFYLIVFGFTNIFAVYSFGIVDLLVKGDFGQAGSIAIVCGLGAIFFAMFMDE